MVKVSIVNVVATAALGQRVDLEELGRYPQIVHDAEIYGGRVAYFRAPKVAGEVTIFAALFRNRGFSARVPNRDLSKQKIHHS